MHLHVAQTSLDVSVSVCVCVCACVCVQIQLTAFNTFTHPSRLLFTFNNNGYFCESHRRAVTVLVQIQLSLSVSYTIPCTTDRKYHFR